MHAIKPNRRPVKSPPYRMSGRALDHAVRHMPLNARTQLARELATGAITLHNLTPFQAAKICAAPARTAE
jgi:hypothetical protein